MFNRFLLIFAFSGQSHNGTLSQAQSLQFEQAFCAGAFAVGGHSDFRREAFCFFNKLSSRASVQTVRSCNGNFLLEHCISPTYRFSVVELKSSLAAGL
ncbi:putative unidentified ORF [Enterobacter cloacae S611]|uniref:Unidentified ORF n=1 Tax=Enterobacter cloacae S611 TaxID=1399146 RepID=A0ABN0QB52_ENTCL|nr:putative unidentified ORF [Enterobacter cloacae S611]